MKDKYRDFEFVKRACKSNTSVMQYNSGERLILLFYKKHKDLNLTGVLHNINFISVFPDADTTKIPERYARVLL